MIIPLTIKEVYTQYTLIAFLSLHTVAIRIALLNTLAGIRIDNNSCCSPTSTRIIIANSRSYVIIVMVINAGSMIIVIMIAIMESPITI